MAWLALVPICFLLFSGDALTESNSSVPPKIVAKAAILEDAATGQVLYAKNLGQTMYPASITKIMTGILAAEYGHPNQVVTIQPSDLVNGSTCYLQAGQQVTMRNLFYGLLLVSGNDCAMAIARTVAGSVPAFVQMMNEKAKELGAKNTHFDNPSGLPDPNHYTSAYDMALFARYALTIPYFRQVDATKTYVFPNPRQPLTFINQDKMLWRYPGGTGMKIGYTVAAGETMVAVAKRGDTELVAVILDSTWSSEWSDVTSLLNYGFNDFLPARVVGRGAVLGNPPVAGDAGITMPVVAGRGFTVLMNKGNTGRLSLNLKTPASLRAPVNKGQQVGTMVIGYAGRVLGEVPVLAASATSHQPFPPWALLAGVAVLLFGTARLARRGNNRWPSYRKTRHYGRYYQEKYWG